MSDYFLKFLVFKFSIEKKLEFELKSNSFPGTEKNFISLTSLQCHFEGEERDCTEIFIPVITDDGGIQFLYFFFCFRSFSSFCFELFNFANAILAILFQGNAVHST